MDPIDSELKQTMRRWAARQTAPATGRARLLAAITSQNVRFKRPTSFQRVELPTDLLTWATVYMMHSRIRTLNPLS